MLSAPTQRALRAACAGATVPSAAFSSLASASATVPSAALSSQASMQLEDKWCARTYSPLPFVISRASGIYTWSPEGVQRMDFLSAFSAANQGHCHPRIVAALTAQASQLTLISRAFHTDALGPYAEYLCRTMGYPRMLPANSGVEGWEVALKLARKWAYTTKRVQPDQAVVLFPEGNFGGRTLGAISASTDPSSYGGYGPLLPGIRHVPFGDAAAVEAALAADPNIIAFYTEPIQGEAGIVLPPQGYLAAVAAACARHGALLIADEVQTGLGRAGSLLASWGEGVASASASALPPQGVRPDIVVLGKALGGGVLPVSAVLASDAIMLSILPGEHGSTFGGNPLACAVATAALQVIEEEGLCANAVARGEELLAGYRAIAARWPLVFKEARGVGLMHALEMREGAVDETGAPVSAWQLCLALGAAGELHGQQMGLLTKPTHGNTLRLTPPLVITQGQVRAALGILEAVVERVLKGGASREGRRK